MLRLDLKENKEWAKDMPGKREKGEREKEKSDVVDQKINK